MKNQLAIPFAALLLLPSFALPARAITTTAAPLKVTNCTVGYLSETIPGYRNGFTNGVTVTVVNVSPRTITSFTGGGSYNNTLVTDSVTHTIAPGTTYTFKKYHKPFFYSGSSATCSVWKVTFDDGTRWTSPDKPESVN